MAMPAGRMPQQGADTPAAGGLRAVARRSLAAFAVGRTLGALAGLAGLLLLVRVLGRADYGLYIALLAGFEIAQIAASPGAHAAAARYLPELRAAPAGAAEGTLARFVLGSGAYVLLTLALAATLLAAAADAAAEALGAPQQAAALRLFAWVLVFEGTARFVELQFESLLAQGLAQGSAVARNGTRVLALLVLSEGASREVPLAQWIACEAAIAAAGLLLAVALMGLHLRRRSGTGWSWHIRPSADADTRSGAAAGPTASRWRPYAAATWAAHLLGVASGVELVKVLAGSSLGLAAAAPFAFAAALAGVVQRYLPGMLLLGWLRPLLIAARSSGQSAQALAQLGATLFKLNLMLLLPLVCLVVVAGPALVQGLSGGRLSESLPFVVFFAGLLLLQALRSVLTLLCVTLELGAASLRATLASALALAACSAAFPLLGMAAFCVGLAAWELAGIAAMAIALRRAGLPLALPTAGLARLAAAAGLACAGALAVKWVWAVVAAPGPWAELACGAAAALAALALAACWKPFSAEERQRINALLPSPLFVW
jgi:O-antigen/teichoic acid export membrane protein